MIYYRTEDNKVYRISTDGSSPASNVVDSPVFYYQVYGNYVYYINENYEINGTKYLYRMKLDGTDVTILSEAVGFHFSILNNKIYIDLYENNHNFLYSMNLDGTEKKKIVDINSAYHYQITDSSVFFGDKKIWEINLEDSTTVGSIDVSPAVPREYIIDKDWIYYLDGYGDYSYIGRMRKDGTEITYIHGQSRLLGLNVIGDWIYYLVSEDVPDGFGFAFKTYRIKTDGGNSEKVN